MEHLTAEEKEVAHKIALLLDNVVRGRTTRGIGKDVTPAPGA